MVLTAPAMVRRVLSARLYACLSIGLTLILLAIAPFAVAQDVHHELAAVDNDGHEHSDNDLCQWVQHHSSGSVDLGGPDFSVWQLVSELDNSHQRIQLSTDFPFVGPSRAPPQI